MSAQDWAADDGLPFYTALDIASMTSAEPEWIAAGYAALEAITELDGKVKASGKTTLTLDLTAAVLDGRPWLGQPTRRARVVYITEQQRGPFLAALTRAGLADRGDELLILFRRDFRGLPWARIVEMAVAKCREAGAVLLVVDTIAKLAGIKNENDAGEWTAAMSPLQDAAHDGLAIWLCRHSRKGTGDVGDTGRGNSAASGDVDIILDLRRPEGNQPGTRRVLESLSRYDVTPEKSVIELRPEGYALLGTEEAVSKAEALRFIPVALERGFDRKQNRGPTRDELVAAGQEHEPPINEAAIRRALAEYQRTGEVRSAGKGVRNDPYRYEWHGPR